MRKKSRVNLQPQKDKQAHDEDQEVNKPAEKQQKFSLYMLLQVQRSATIEQIKKQYRKLVLKYHPDKNLNDPSAREKFQKLKLAFDILSDQEKRKIYDQTGLVGSQEQFDQKGFQSAYEYFRSMYKKVSEEDILDFQKKYKHGQMQQEDLVDYYQQNQGNMVQLIESIPLSTNQDIPRFILFFQERIKGKLIPKYKSFDKTKGKVRFLKDEKEEFEQFEKQKKKGSFDELALAIRQNRQNQQQGFLASLQEKYGGANKKKAKAEHPVQPKNKKKNKNS